MNDDLQTYTDFTHRFISTYRSIYISNIWDYQETLKELSGSCTNRGVITLANIVTGYISICTNE